MARGGSVLAGIRAAQAQQTASAVPSVGTPGGALSPLLAQYGQWTLGRTPGNISLPRDPLEYLTGAFGPLMPITPAGIDAPPPDAERPEPRRWQYPVGWNMPMGQPGAEGLKLADFQTLRLYADMYSIARACIQLRKDEMLGVGWDIGATPDAAKAMRGDRAAMADFGVRRAEALKFFKRPDPNYNDFGSWFDALLEDVFVIDALSLYLHPTRVPGKGLFGTDLAGLDLIDGTMVRPLLDVRGGSPQPPSPAYQIYQYGVPRVDLMTMLAQDDLKDLGKPAAQYRGDQLLYIPRNPRSWTPYGQAPLERCVIPVITGLRKQQYALDFYQEGSVPGVYISPGDANLTPNQIREIQDTLNAIAGDVAYKHKIVMLPANSRVEPQKPPALADQSDEIIISQVCMAFSVMPMELGVSPKVSATQSSGAAHQMAKASQDIHERKTLKPDLLWLKKAIFDRIIQDICGQEDMEWQWDGLEEDEDEETLTSLLVQQIGAGLASIDEARIELGRQPWGLPITADPGWAGQMGFTALGQMSPDGAPEVGVPPPPPPGAPPGAPPGGAPGAPPQLPPPSPVATGAPPKPPSAPPPPSAAPPPGAAPAHHAAAAAGAQTQPPRAVAKAAAAELESLARHVRKGRSVATWEARHIPAALLAGIDEDLRKGITIDQAVEVAAKALPAEALPDVTPARFPAEHGAGGIPVADPEARGRELFEAYAYGTRRPSMLAKGDTGAAVAAQLAEDFPPGKLGWVTNPGVVTWTGPKAVPVAAVDASGVRSWQASHEQGKVDRFAAKQIEVEANGGHLKPAVLIDAPGTERGTHMMVADGHHRLLAAKKNNRPVWAYIGRTTESTGPWDELHAYQRTEGAGTPYAAAKGAARALAWEHDRDIAAGTAAAITAALGDAVDAGDLARGWLEARRVTPALTAEEYLVGAGVPATVNAALAPVIAGTWSEAYALGAESARDHLGGE